ncbi:MAG: SusC/RagA family TonB-linked outer membrane protein [Tannerella sp.]|jgi:TonB-linked SusC/RagA family outer membrane protein|nr:SusC/RagA family TonB-linked outer membrane protein [Tannerella sp.]
MKDRQIILNRKGDFAEAPQKKTVTGTIIDPTGEPIIGASVLEQGTSNGVLTDVDGHFTLTVNTGAVLRINYLGYITQEVAVGNLSNLQITLSEDVQALGEVVVTALGLKREEKALGYAVQNLKGDNLQTVKGINVATSLTGKIAGVNVLNSTEFGQAPTIQLRGENPLIVIDGVPYANMTLGDIAADDIESMSVLKGATASALYGARGQNGSIMVTTKKGADKDGFSVTVNSGTMFTAGYLAIPELQSQYGRVVQTNADGTLQYVGTGDGSWGPPMEGQEVIQWDPVTKSMRPMPFIARGKDNFKNFLEQGYILNNNVSLAQKGEYGNIRASVNWVNNKGNYPNSTFNKYAFSLGGDILIDKITVTAGLSYNKQISPNLGFNGYTGYDPMYTMLIWASPDWDVRDYKDYWIIPNETQNSSYTAGNNNPYFDRYERLHSLDKDIFNGSFEVKYEPSKFINSLARIGYDTYSNRQDVRISKGSFQGGGNSTILQPNGTEVWGESMKGSYNIGLGRGYSINGDFITSANYTFGDFTADGMIGGSMMYQQDEGMQAFTAGGLSVPGFYSLNASINPKTVTSRIYKRQTNSLYGRAGLSWRSLVFAEVTLRNDWVSTLPETTRSYLYPSVSGSFLVSELLPKTDWLSLWKLRASWVTSKKPADIYAINSVFAVSNNVWGTLSSAALPTTIRGTDIFPESTSTFEIGTAINLLKNRLSFDVAHYQRKAFDFIKNASISPASGYLTNFVNTDEEITRKGWEVTVNATPVENKDFSWDVSLNWTKYADYYTKLDSVYTTNYGWSWVKVGERADPYIYRDYLRDPEGNIIHNASGNPTLFGYNAKFGNQGPDWIWGLSTSLRYKDWLLGLSFDGRVGGLITTVTEMYMWQAGSHPESLTPERYLDATQPGTKNYIGKGVKIVSGTVEYDTYGNILNDTRVFAPNDIPTTYSAYAKALHPGTAWGGNVAEPEILSGTFLKLRELSLTYNVPKAICSKFRAEQLSISAVGQNVLFWAKDFKYSDPDGGTENFADPSQRFLGFNIKLGF